LTAFADDILRYYPRLRRERKTVIPALSPTGDYLGGVGP
jgi:hypothetical protein